jgi:hypothetical protein
MNCPVCGEPLSCDNCGWPDEFDDDEEEECDATTTIQSGDDREPTGI